MSKPKILLLGKLPPPFIGPAIATEILLNSGLSAEFELIHLDTSDPRDINTLARLDVMNFYLAIKQYCLVIIYLIRYRPSVVYFPAAQTTIAYLRDIPFVIAAKIFRKKVICHLRGGNFKNWYDSASIIMKLIVKTIHPLIDAQIVLGERLRALYSWLIPENRIFVVPNGMNVSYKNKKPEEQKKQKSEKKITILFLGNLIETKGYRDLLSSIGDVINHSRNVRYVFAGAWMNDEDKKLIEQYIEDNNISGYVEFRGTVTGHHKEQLLVESDIFVFPTYYPNEGHPWVIIEAMAAGLPVISTDQGAITESVIDGVSGFIVGKQNPAQIAGKIRVLIENPDLRMSMGREGRRRYEAYFTEEKMVESLTHAFNSVLNRN